MVIHNKPIANITENILSKLRNKKGCLVSPLLLNILFDMLARGIKQEREIKGLQIGKEDAKLFLL